MNRLGDAKRDALRSLLFYSINWLFLSKKCCIASRRRLKASSVYTILIKSCVNGVLLGDGESVGRGYGSVGSEGGTCGSERHPPTGCAAALDGGRSRSGPGRPRARNRGRRRDESERVSFSILPRRFLPYDSNVIPLQRPNSSRRYHLPVGWRHSTSLPSDACQHFLSAQSYHRSPLAGRLCTPNLGEDKITARC